MILVRSPRLSYGTAAALALTGGACVLFAVTHQLHATAVALSPPDARVTTPVVPAAPLRAVPMAPAVAVALPTAISIPAIGVRSTLLALGQAADGTVETPTGSQYDQAGWYRYSPRPGAMGPAVIVGHVDSKAAGPSVFFRLGDLRPRDLVDVVRADGSTAVFVVEDVRRFHKAQFPTQLVYGNTDHAALRLITCGGLLDPATGHYLDNIVVSASLRGA